MSKLDVKKIWLRNMIKNCHWGQKSVRWERSIKNQNSETGLLKPKWGWHS